MNKNKRPPYSSYETYYEKFHKKIKLGELFTYFKDNKKTKTKFYIESYYNGHYPVFDLNSEDIMEKFKKNYKDIPYVLFLSSVGHYWGIIDKIYYDLNYIFKDNDWNIINDENYVALMKNKKLFFIKRSVKHTSL